MSDYELYELLHKVETLSKEVETQKVCFTAMCFLLIVFVFCCAVLLVVSFVKEYNNGR